MAEKYKIRGPIPNDKVTNGTQFYIVPDPPGAAFQIQRKIILTWQSGELVSATCTCTPRATLHSPCSHLYGVLEYIGKINLAPKPVNLSHHTNKTKTHTEKSTATVNKVKITRSVKNTSSPKNGISSNR